QPGFVRDRHVEVARKTRGEFPDVDLVAGDLIAVSPPRGLVIVRGWREFRSAFRYNQRVHIHYSRLTANAEMESLGEQRLQHALVLHETHRSCQRTLDRPPLRPQPAWRIDNLILPQPIRPFDQ